MITDIELKELDTLLLNRDISNSRKNLVDFTSTTLDGFECEDFHLQYYNLLDVITPLDDLLGEFQPKLSKEDSYFVKEFVLWALSEYKQLNKNRFTEGIQFKDLYSSFIQDL